MPVTHTMDDGVAVLKLELERGNAINLPFIDALNRALDEAETSAATRAVVVTGTGKMFSGGLDLLWCYELDRPGMAHFVDAFDNLFLRLFVFPKPMVAAVNGHALAGG